MTKYGRDKDGQYFISSYRVIRDGVVVEGPFIMEGIEKKEPKEKKIIKNEV